MTATDLGELSSAAEVLSALNKINDNMKKATCKRITKLLYSETSQLPSIIYYKAQLHRYLDCATLSGVSGEIDDMLKVKTDLGLEKMSDEEVYFAYLLH